MSLTTTFLDRTEKCLYQTRLGDPRDHTTTTPNPHAEDVSLIDTEDRLLYPPVDPTSTSRHLSHHAL